MDLIEFLGFGSDRLEIIVSPLAYIIVAILVAGAMRKYGKADT